MSAASAFARGGTGTVSRRDGAAGQVYLRERMVTYPRNTQPAGVRPGYERAAGVHILRMPKNIIHLYPLHCYYYPRKDIGNSKIMNVA